MAWTTPTTRATGYVVTAAVYNADVINNLAYLKGQAGQIAFEDAILVPKASAVPITSHRTDAGAALMALYEGRRNTAAKWWLGLNASDEFAVLNAAGNAVNWSLTDAGVATVLAGLTVTAGATTLNGVTSSTVTLKVATGAVEMNTLSKLAPENGSGALFVVDGIITENGLTNPYLAGLYIGALQITQATGCTTAVGASLYVEGAASGATTNVAVYVAAGGQIIAAGGLQMGAPTGGDKGDGTINVAAGVYLNNGAYGNPDYALEHWATGQIVRYADRPGAKDYPGLRPLLEVEGFAREHWHLPRIGRGPSDIFQRADWTLEKIEELHLYLFEHERRLAALEAS